MRFHLFASENVPQFLRFGNKYIDRFHLLPATWANKCVTVAMETDDTDTTWSWFLTYNRFFGYPNFLR